MREKLVSAGDGSTELHGFPGVSVKAEATGGSATCLSVLEPFPLKPICQPGNNPDLNDISGGNSQKRGNNKSISLSILLPVFNFGEYLC